MRICECVFVCGERGVSFVGDEDPGLYGGKFGAMSKKGKRANSKTYGIIFQQPFIWRHLLFYINIKEDIFYEIYYEIIEGK